MFNQSQAQNRLKEALPGYPIKAWAKYGDIFLFRIEHPGAGEEIWEPFFSVDELTGQVNEFSPLVNGDLTEINELKWHEL